jgi:hypothetical protein
VPGNVKDYRHEQKRPNNPPAIDMRGNEVIRVIGLTDERAAR